MSFTLQEDCLFLFLFCFELFVYKCSAILFVNTKHGVRFAFDGLLKTFRVIANSLIINY